MVQQTLLLALISALTVSAAPLAQQADIKCPIVLDGRVKTTLVPTDFDSYATSPFNPDYVKGNDLKWSGILQFPTDVGVSRFDGNASAYKPFEVTISDASVFQQQKGFRRAGLQIQGRHQHGQPRRHRRPHDPLQRQAGPQAAPVPDARVPQRLARGERLLRQPVQLRGWHDPRPDGPVQEHLQGPQQAEQADLVHAH